MGLLINVIDILFTIVTWAIIIRVIISWVRPDSTNPSWRQFLRYVYQLTEPILAPLRRLLPTGNIGLDFSPLIAIIVLQIIRNFIIRLLYSI